MLEEDGSPNTAHSMNPVPVVITADVGSVREGILGDVSPTVLALLGQEQPEAMTGESLVRKIDNKGLRFLIPPYQ